MSTKPKSRNEALEMAMKRGQQKALGKPDDDSDDSAAEKKPAKKRAASPTTRNEALEMAMKRGQQKAGLRKQDSDEEDDSVPAPHHSRGSAASAMSAPVREASPKTRNEALEMAMARGRAKAGLVGDGAVSVGSNEHKEKM